MLLLPHLQVSSMMADTAVASLYIDSAINKFYTLGNKVLMNATILLEQAPDMLGVAFRPQLQKYIATAIQQRNNNIGNSRLWVDGPLNPVSALQGIIARLNFRKPVMTISCSYNYSRLMIVFIHL